MSLVKNITPGQWVLMALFATTNLLDAITTAYAVGSLSMTEGNPMYAYLFEHFGVTNVLTAKIVLALLIAAGLIRTGMTRTLTVLVVVFGIIALWNGVSILTAL